MKKAPKIRFDGYTEDWEQRKLSAIITEKLSNGVINKSGTEDSNVKHINVINMYTFDKIHTEDLALSSHDEKTIQKCNVEVGDIFMTRSSLKPEGIAEANVLLDSGRYVFDDHLIRMKVDKSKYDPMFVKINLGNRMIKTQFMMRSKTTAFTTIGQEDISECEGKFPCLEEQKKIGEYFQNIDRLITHYQKECEKMLDFKEYMLKKMFPREGFSVPEIRFNGFDGAWSKYRLGELVVKFEDPVETPTGGYMRLGIKSHAKGTFHSYVKEGEGLETAKMFRVAPNKFIVNITFGWEHAVAITDEHDADKLVSHRFPQYSFKEGMRPDFFKWIILDKRFKYHLGVSSPGGAGRNRVLNLESMLEYETFVPSVKEQQAIGQYFRKLDELILLHQHEVEAYKKMKQYMLQNMFV